MLTRQTIFIVEDDDSIRDMVSYALSSSGFDTTAIASGSAFWETITVRNNIPSLILLDIMLPGDDGVNILRKIKQMEKYKKIPVIMLTAKSGEFDRIKGLDLGADDYITKPFSVLELISRARAVLRRCADTDDKNTKDTELKVGLIKLNNDRRSVSVNDKEVILTYKEFELLYFLMLNEGIVMTRDKLLEYVWGFDYNGESRTVDMHVKSLRKKLETGGSSIITVRNVGYKIRG